MHRLLIAASAVLAVLAHPLLAQEAGRAVARPSRVVVAASLDWRDFDGLQLGSRYRGISVRYERASGRVLGWASAEVATDDRLRCYNPGAIGVGSGCGQTRPFIVPLRIGLTLRLSPERHGFVPYVGGGFGFASMLPHEFDTERLFQVGWDLYLTSRLSLRNELLHGAVMGGWRLVAGLAWWL